MHIDETELWDTEARMKWLKSPWLSAVSLVFLVVGAPGMIDSAHAWAEWLEGRASLVIIWMGSIVATAHVTIVAHRGGEPYRTWLRKSRSYGEALCRTTLGVPLSYALVDLTDSPPVAPVRRRRLRIGRPTLIEFPFAIDRRHEFTLSLDVPHGCRLTFDENEEHPSLFRSDDYVSDETKNERRYTVTAQNIPQPLRCLVTAHWAGPVVLMDGTPIPDWLE